MGNLVLLTQSIALQDHLASDVHSLSAVLFLLYFVPSLLAWKRRNVVAIVALNLLLGWTVIGWIVALIWALKQDAPVRA